MKKTILVSLLIVSVLSALAESPKREFRATWLATVSSIDWPRTKVASNATRETQKRQLTDIFDMLVDGNMNACCMQVRSLCDAMYKSSYEPWSPALTGERGEDPGYDPLEFAIEEAHKRGLELHVWVNPFRYETSTGAYGNDDMVRKNCKQWIISYNNGSYSGTILDPGFPEARAYVIKVLMEIVRNYDVDGILMDDYFYPYGGTTTEDAVSLAKYKPADMDAADWRRENVDKCMKMLYDSIQACKPWVRFGMGPFGIWTTKSAVAQKYGISLPNHISGLDDYNVQYCNTVEWVKGGYVDYIAPQLYWPTTSYGQDYDILSKWWAQDVCKHFSELLPNGKKVHSFVSQACYRFDSSELGLEVDDNRAFAPFDAPGSIFYNTNTYTYLATNYDGVNVKEYISQAMRNTKFTEKALPPAMDWKKATKFTAPSNVKQNGTSLTWTHPTAERFTVYAYPKGTNKTTALSGSTYLLGIVWGNSYDLTSVVNFTSKTFAICPLDRFGNEYEAAFFNEDSSTPGQEVAVTGIKLNQTSLSLGVEEQFLLIPTISPSNATNQTVRWTCDNLDVARVTSDGLVRAIEIGDATITATTVDGNFSATCKVSVVIPVQKVSLGRAHSLNLKVGASKKITAVITPSDATNKNVIWTTENAAVATVTEDGLSATVEAVGNGETRVIVTTEEGQLADTCVVTVTGGESAVDNVQDVVAQVISTDYGIYVNFAGEAMVSVYAADGRLLDQRLAQGEYICPLEKGIYLVRVGKSNYKVIKQ